MKKSTKTILISLLVIVLIVVLALSLSNLGKPTEITQGDLEQKIRSGMVDQIYIKGNYEAYILLKAPNSKVDANKFPNQADNYVKIFSRRDFENYLYNIEQSIRNDNGGVLPDGWKKPIVSYNNPDEGSFWVNLIPIFGFLIITGLFIYIFKKSQGSNSMVMNFSKNKARLNDNIKVRFDDVAGADEEKEELQEIVEFLKNPKKFSDLGARIPKGVLLVGPPGTGKTLFAKAVAGEAGVPFFSISGSDFVEMFVGTGAARVRDMFSEARKNMPCIVFIDEIDAVGRQRGTGLGGGHDEREQTLNQLLVQMDGFEHSDGIIIMAATNRADILDPALLRPGRFDRQIAVNPPDVKGREAIFRVHSRNKPLDKDIDFKKLGRLTTGFTGADIENLLNEAAILAARKNQKLITMNEIYEAINKVIAGPQKKSHVVTETDKRITAFHEAGHAIVGQLLPYCDNVQEVSIIPRGMAAGYTITRPDSDDEHVTKNKLEDTIAMMLAGRAAEEIIIHDISTGASNDIQRASGIARKMVTEWGMSNKLGNFFLGQSGEVFIGRDFGSQHQYSEQIAGIIDEEIKDILDRNYKRAIDLLTEHKSVLNNMVMVLFDRETIYSDEVQLLFEGKSADEIIAYSIKRDNDRYNHAKKNDAPTSEVKAEPIVTSADSADKATSDNNTVDNTKADEVSDTTADKDNSTVETATESTEPIVADTDKADISVTNLDNAEANTIVDDVPKDTDTEDTPSEDIVDTEDTPSEDIVETVVNKTNSKKGKAKKDSADND